MSLRGGRCGSLRTRKRQRSSDKSPLVTLVAPIDGVLVYGDDSNPWSDQPQIEQGATVRDGQKIVTIHDLSHMQMNVRVRELHVDRLATNMKAKIRVDAFVDEILTGTVGEIAGRPDRSFRSKTGAKFYPTRVRIDQPITGLRPGMTAEAEILIAELDNVLSVPVKAVLLYDGKEHVIVKKPEGGLEWREVTLGMSNEEYVEVKAGIVNGEAVVVDPSSLTSGEDHNRKSGGRLPKKKIPSGSASPTKPAQKAKGQEE